MTSIGSFRRSRHRQREQGGNRAAKDGHEVRLQKRVFPQLSLCLSRACLGKKIVFSIKWHRKNTFP
jgi:hypothetical protein